MNTGGPDHHFTLTLARACLGFTQPPPTTERVVDRAMDAAWEITTAEFLQKEKAVEEEPEMDPDVASMMGFGGFKSSKK